MPFKPGQSGNPGGRPKRKLVSEALAKELARRVAHGEPTQAQQAAETLVGLMLKGDVSAAKLVLSYVEGLPMQSHEVTGAEGGPLEFTIEIARASHDGEPDARDG